MRLNNFFLFLGLSSLLPSCNSEKDKILLKELDLASYKKLEVSLNSEELESNKTPLAFKFLPKDTSLLFFKVASYRRHKFSVLPLTTSAYKDTLGNFLAVYIWDKITPDMSQSEKEKIKREFDKHHGDYVAQYNVLTDELTEVLGPPKTADKKLQASDMEVYQFWESGQIWEREDKIVELNLVIMPNETYRVIVKILALKK